jgi:8-oxo-dGTP pyrophosphatase MutT (NUDIX family)
LYREVSEGHEKRYELLIGRTRKGDSWTLLGGKREQGEVSHETALREFNEESGSQLSAHALISLRSCLPVCSQVWLGSLQFNPKYALSIVNAASLDQAAQLELAALPTQHSVWRNSPESESEPIEKREMLELRWMPTEDIWNNRSGLQFHPFMKNAIIDNQLLKKMFTKS